jgi:hypothetical protein
MELDRQLLEQALSALGDVLEARGHRFELVAIGGSGLMLLGLGVRPTKDLDVIAVVKDQRYERVDHLPGPLAQAVGDVAATFGLGEDWLNPGPASLLELGLPDGFEERTEARTYAALVLHVASRTDQIYFKLYAGADMGPDSKHIRDLKRLEPSEDELLDAGRWAITHDPSRGFRSMLLKALEHFGIADAQARL